MLCTPWLAAIASVADKVNLKFSEAKPVLAKQVSKEISGIFG
ncbi:complement resistance protein TraT [Piscirickettsia salmonis]